MEVRIGIVDSEANFATSGAIWVVKGITIGVVLNVRGI